MKIIDSEKREEIENLTLLLTASEASELKDELERLLRNHSQNMNDHGHVPDENFEKEITVAIYGSKNDNFVK